MKNWKKIIYWITTLWLALGMISTGMVQLNRGQSGPGALESLSHLEYPAYLAAFLGVMKILGSAIVLMPRFPILKEWAYAGFFFIMAGAIYSHLTMGDGIAEILPAILLLLLTGFSWYLRPAGRKPVPAIRRAGSPYWPSR